MSLSCEGVEVNKITGTRLCDACLRPMKSHLPSEIDDCSTYDPWNCEGCGNLLEGHGGMRVGALCLDCAEIANNVVPGCTFFKPHPPGYVRRMVGDKFEWVAP